MLLLKYHEMRYTRETSSSLKEHLYSVHRYFPRQCL